MSTVESAVLALLSPVAPMPEQELKRLTVGSGLYAEYEVQKAVNGLQTRNEIRWVAFHGWCRGGRPS